MPDGRLIRQVRAALELGDGPGEVWPVVRIDLPNDAYWLVHLPAAVGGKVAVVDMRTEELLQSASTSAAPVALDAIEATIAADLLGESTTRLVWKPSAASMSPFSPLWEVTNGTSTVSVDQNGVVQPQLDTDHRG